MPQSNSVAGARLHDLLPDLLSALSERFECVECEIEKCPDLSSAPFRLTVSRIGSQLCIVSTTECADVNVAIGAHCFNGKPLGLIQGRHVLSTDDSPALGLRLRLKNATTTPIDRSLWRPAAKDSIRRLRATGDVPSEFLCIEVADDTNAEVSLLADELTVSSTNTAKILDVWLFPATKVIGTRPIENGAETPKPKKRIRRVVKSTNPDGTPKKTLVSTKTVVGNGGIKVVKKRIVDKSSPKENSPDVVQEVVEDPSNVSFLVRMGQPVNGVEHSISNGVINTPKSDSKMETQQKEITVQPAQLNGTTNSVPRAPDLPIVDQTRPSPPTPVSTPINGSAVNDTVKTPTLQAKAEPAVPSTPTPLIDSASVEVSSSETNSPDNLFLASTSLANSTFTTNSLTETSATSTISSSISSTSDKDKPKSTTNSAMTNGVSKNAVDHLPESDVPQLNGFIEVPPQIIEQNGKKQENQQNTTKTLPTKTLSNSTSLEDRMFSPISDLINQRIMSPLTNGRRLSPDSDLSLFEDLSTASTLTTASQQHRTERRRSTMSPIVEGVASGTVRGMGEVPVIALQLVLGMFSYRELAELRRVHPHWDELCGQLLNSGYYDLIHRADVLLTDCQRRANAEPHLQRPLQVLTNLQVHVLNPVDILRAAMDEGVLCFPYGELLDKVERLLNRIVDVMNMPEEEGDAIVLNWDRLAQLSRMAQRHYRRYVEPEVEKRMTEVYKLSAQQRLQRLDSFLVESTVTKLEKVAGQTRDELKWEVDQLKTQNTQLKKDNRELKQLCARLESRIDMIERKFKTMARLLQ
ncbi:hypothetical protein M3Y96_00100800 [Aphelenchoides besseyi]|nr:hypothetical protein M3Y96_00100800 [Aphelenchoides besseyi]